MKPCLQSVVLGSLLPLAANCSKVRSGPSLPSSEALRPRHCKGRKSAHGRPWCAAQHGASVCYALNGRLCNSGKEPSQTQLRSGFRPTCMFSLGGRVTRHGSDLGWDRPSGWSRRSMQGQDLRAAPPQVRFEPKLPTFCGALNVRIQKNAVRERTVFLLTIEIVFDTLCLLLRYIDEFRFSGANTIDVDMLRKIDPAEIVASLRESLLVLTEDLVVEYANDQFFATFEVDRDETIGATLSSLGNGQWNISTLIGELERILDHGQKVEDVEVDHVFQHIGRRVMRLNARKTIRPGNGSRRILLAIDDVTAESDAAAALEREQLLSKGIVDTVREPLLVLDDRLEIISASRAFYSTFHVDPAETVGRRLDDLGNGQWAIPALLELLTEVVPRNTTVEDFEVKHVFSKIGERSILLNARKIHREGNHTHTLLLAMQDITERRRLEAERAAALHYAERLLEELNHRVMNSLSMIGGIIALEARNLSDEACRAAFMRMRARVDAVGSLYKTLSRAGAVDQVNTRQYLTALVEDLLVSSGQAKPPELQVDVVELPLSTRVAVPLGLIVNELATNSLKYAFSEHGGGQLSVLLKVENKTLQLSISDNGAGIDANARVDSGLGQKLTEAFTTQLDGQMTIESDRTGTRHMLVFPHISAESRSW
ncbi:sensory transduction regulatory protein [Roseobacter sp. GAI101]|nr:sensory transduction regulatory protein [Roseobacter sp. GAI101]